MNVIKARGCVALAAEGFDAPIKLTGSQVAAPLKHHVLKEVGQATFPGGLIDAAGATPKIDADQGGGLHAQDHHLGSSGKLASFGVAVAWQQGQRGGQGQGREPWQDLHSAGCWAFCEHNPSLDCHPCKRRAPSLG